MKCDSVIIDPDGAWPVMRFWFYGGPGCLSFHAEPQLWITPYGEAMHRTGEWPVVIYDR